MKLNICNHYFTLFWCGFLHLPYLKYASLISSRDISAYLSSIGMLLSCGTYVITMSHQSSEHKTHSGHVCFDLASIFFSFPLHFFTEITEGIC